MKPTFILILFLFAPTVLVSQSVLRTNGGYTLTTPGGKIIATSPWSCGSPLTINHILANGVAPVNKTINYGTVTSSLSGSPKCWITQNLGADRQALAANDATEESAGWYWQFNRKQGYQYISFVYPITWDATTDNSYPTWDPLKDPCTIELGSAWRIPTNTEYTNADASWSSWTVAYESDLKLHAAEFLDYTSGWLQLRGTRGNYWSSTQNSATDGLSLYFSSSNSYTVNNYKAYGFSVRCIKD